MIRQPDAGLSFLGSKWPFLIVEVACNEAETYVLQKARQYICLSGVKVAFFVILSTKKRLRIDLIDPPTLLINPPVARLDGAASDEPAKADTPTDALYVWIFKRVITTAPDRRKFITAAAVIENLEVYPNRRNEDASFTISWSDISNLPHGGSKTRV